MLENFLKKRIIAQLPFDANAGQLDLIEQICLFITRRAERSCFVMTGYAGTGKSSVTGALVRALNEMQQHFVLLAPTGRAAKVLTKYSGFPAYTIHKFIYRRESATGDKFQLGWNRDRDTLFVVDEASMISSDRDNDSFGSGSLLDDLIKFVYQDADNNCRLLLIGDNAQLPPVGHLLSPAIDSNYLKGYGLNLEFASLTEVARQAKESGILRNATSLRQRLDSQELTDNPLNLIEEVKDVKKVDGQQIVEEIECSYRVVGEEDTIILTRSNKRANLYNQGVRAQLLWREGLLSSGDRIMVSRNNYFFTQEYNDMPFLANGDLFEIVRLRNERELYGYTFADASLKAIDYEWEIDAIVWLNTLTTDSPDKNIAMQKDLFARIAEDYPEIHNKKELLEKIKSSPYYNALHIRYAYAITCHKAQGGQWKHVFIDAGDPNFQPQQFSSLPKNEQQQEQFRWLYTALTRATEKVYLLKY